MKRYVSFIMLFLFIIISIVTYNYYQKKEIYIGKKEEIKEANNSSIAIMLQNEEGQYVKSTSNEWPKDGYAFNETYSSCENGSKLSWNIETGEITLISNISDKCYVYFDKVDIYNVTVEVTGGHVDQSPKKVVAGREVSFTLTADEGYDLTKAKVTSGNCSLSNNNATLSAKSVVGNITCKVEIPKKSIPFMDYLTPLVGKTSGDGNLYYHDASLADGVGDKSYRYAGNEPNNYVCLGTKTTSGGCNDNKNLYRIIGVIPVKVVIDENHIEEQNLIKLIKSEYITKEELGGWGSSTYGDSSSALTLYSSGAKYARIKNQSGINSFYWSGSSSNESNEWQQSSLYSTLNNATTGYLSKMSEWKDKIETVTWNIAGVSNAEYNKPAKDVFTVEMNNSTGGSVPTTTKTVNAQVGLMYASDYGFASSKDNWQTSLFDYDRDANRRANWLYNAVNEWTISRSSANSAFALYVDSTGLVRGSDRVFDRADGVRPSFYLKSTVKYLEGEGSYEKPIFLN